ncbi:hypothetical protein PMAYCL1PPCAC_18387 [Pristionchus mayeri]|uniref:H/ACA ribonucleoprotein complex non-core subunit NAF1 n=1 Tax=Pristionchus mayeri TaxID=1317129 RepID=A0AAN5I192_9BILA|nr:hypothetical protein PMAYCL1PPCAC_18387 [Pristionchus mayeri]
MTEASSVVPTGALASIADYASESEYEELKGGDNLMIEIAPDNSNMEGKSITVDTDPQSSKPPDFEIPVDVIEEDGGESGCVGNAAVISLSEKDESTGAPISNPFAMRQQIDLEDSGTDDELPTLNISDDDSDAEFDRILAYTAKQRKKDFDRSMGQTPSKRTKTEVIAKDLEREYDKLPPIENLTISVQECIPMRRLGSVKHIVDCLVVIEADSGLAIDYDSVIFREDRRALGQVFDIFGAVRCPSYSIRFNSEKEAKDSASEGMNVFVAENDQYTRKIMTENLKNEKHVDGVLVLNERGEEEELFSDDETEEAAKKNGGGGRGRGRGMKRTRGGGRGGHFNQKKMSWPPNQRGRGRGEHSQFSSPYAGGGGPPMIDTRYMGGV